jgi:hypothetical protein
MSEPLPPANRTPGSGDPPADFNDVDTILALLVGITPGTGGTVTTGEIPLFAASVTISGIPGSASSPLSVVGSSDAGQLVYLEQDSSTDHCLTVNLAGTGGATQAALNAVSANPAFSAVEISGTETAHGTVKITHHGYANASDSAAAAISVDLQTTVGGSAGTAAQGLFITSTTDTIPAGDAIRVQYGAQDWFVVKGNTGTGNGIAGIGVASGHTPAGMLEIAQKDTTTVGLAMTALASGADMIDLKNSGGSLMFQVNNSGNVVMRASAFADAGIQVGGTSTQFGGGAGGVIGITNATTAPASNPAGGVVLYASGGHLYALAATGSAVELA